MPNSVPRAFMKVKNTPASDPAATAKGGMTFAIPETARPMAMSAV